MLILFYVCSLTLVYMIPNHMIQENFDKSIQILSKEGDYPSLNQADRDASRLDNYTDRLMYRKTLKKTDHENALRAAMDVENYARYWHGYQIFLRPITMFLNYGAVRQIYGLVLTILLGVLLFLLAKKTDLFLVLSFTISLYAVRYYTFFVSMQFSNVFYILFAYLIYLLLQEKDYYKEKRYYTTFFFVGSLTNFFDLLTVPLLTLGVPLVLIFYLEQTYAKKATLVKPLIISSMMWGIGYGLTWGLKWLIGTLVLQRNVFEDAFHQILFRTTGDQAHLLVRSLMFKTNFFYLFNKVTLLFLLGLGLVMLIYFLSKRKFKFEVGNTIFLVIALYPYFWYLILADHSQIHAWFTYRLQFITIFAGLTFLASQLKKQRKEG